MNGNNLENLEKIFDFLEVAEKLKSTLRYNKTTSGRQESTAEHSWRLALMIFMLADELKLEIDVMAEALTGDIDAILIAEGKISKEEKEIQEARAVEKIQQTLPALVGKEITALQNEYNENKTREAKFVKALDKIETLTQLAESGYKIYDKPEFIANYADKAVGEFPELLETLKIVKRKLKIEFKKGNIQWKKEYDNFCLT
ncbi:MAG: Hydrolase (HAD superfamily) [Candidatus Moranbacteria bacterium GW2011_GWF2_35_54]|nr:MAG: Hydrolase (HAD superfamily) [Candidatus Moranbacteria bacterium GW2011_GWF2_35_54]